MLSRARYILLNAYHILIDGLFDAVPILLAFMVISFGEGEKAMGLIVSVGTAAGTAAGLGTLLLARKLGFMQTITLVRGRILRGHLLRQHRGRRPVLYPGRGGLQRLS